MICVTEISNNRDETIFIDNFVLTIGWESGSPASVVYWRTGNFKTSLLEIGFDKDSGRIRSITLVLVDQIIQASIQRNVRQEEVYGAPVFLSATWPTEAAYVDEVGAVRLWIGETKVFIEIGDLANIVRWITSTKVSLGVDKDGCLQGVEISDLSPRECEAINQMFDKHPQ